MKYWFLCPEVGKKKQQWFMFSFTFWGAAWCEVWIGKKEIFVLFELFWCVKFALFLFCFGSWDSGKLCFCFWVMCSKILVVWRRAWVLWAPKYQRKIQSLLCLRWREDFDVKVLGFQIKVWAFPWPFSAGRLIQRKTFLLSLCTETLCLFDVSNSELEKQFACGDFCNCFID